MTALSDILSLLDRWDQWKRMRAAPDRIDALERRLAALEGGRLAPPAEACPLCGAAMKVTKVEDDPLFGKVGIKQHTLQCAGCGHSETRQVDPNKRR